MEHRVKENYSFSLCPFGILVIVICPSTRLRVVSLSNHLIFVICDLEFSILRTYPNCGSGFPTFPAFLVFSLCSMPYALCPSHRFIILNSRFWHHYRMGLYVSVLTDHYIPHDTGLQSNGGSLLYVDRANDQIPLLPVVGKQGS